MKELKILNSKGMKHIHVLLEKEFGFSEKLQYGVLQNAKSKLYLVNKDIAQIPLESLGIDSVGMYFGEVMDPGIRLSIEGSQLIGPACTKNVVELTPEEMRFWLKGNDVEKEVQWEGFVLLRCGRDFLGCGKYKQGKILNYIPKARRILAED